jgi:hypothetical protein
MLKSMRMLKYSLTLSKNWSPQALPNKRLLPTGLSVSLIDNLSRDAVVARPLKRRVGRLGF